MTALVSALVAKVGVAGLAALWGLKATIGVLLIRAMKKRKTKV